MKKPTFAHVGITCRNIDATVAFYTKFFGYEQARVVPLGKTKIVFLKREDSYLELFQGEGESPLPKFEKDGPPWPGIRHLAYTVENVEQFVKELGDTVRITLGPLAFDDFIKGWKAVWVEDLDGRIIEISQGYKDEKR